MTNRDWLYSLPPNYLAKWLNEEEKLVYVKQLDKNVLEQPTPRLITLQRNNIDLLEWLNKEREIPNVTNV